MASKTTVDRALQNAQSVIAAYVNSGRLSTEATVEEFSRVLRDARALVTRGSRKSRSRRARKAPASGLQHTLRVAQTTLGDYLKSGQSAAEAMLTELTRVLGRARKAVGGRATGRGASAKRKRSSSRKRVASSRKRVTGTARKGSRRRAR